MLLKLIGATFGGTIERVLQCTVRELLVVSVQRVPEGPILDTVTHVVNIHLERERCDAVTCYRMEAKVRQCIDGSRSLMDKPTQLNERNQHEGLECSVLFYGFTFFDAVFLHEGIALHTKLRYYTNYLLVVNYVTVFHSLSCSYLYVLLGFT